MAAKKTSKPAAKSKAKPTAKKPAVKKAVAKKSVKKAIAKPAAKKKIASKSSEKKPAIKTPTVKTAKSSSKKMSKIEVKGSRGQGRNKSKNKFEEVPQRVAAKPTLHRPNESRNMKKVDTETAARLSSKYTVGDIAKFQIKMPKGGIHDATIEEKLQALFQLQQIDSEIDRIRIIRGELPIEVKDLEDDVARLETRIDNFNNDIAEFEQLTAQRKQAIKDANSMIKKYESQQSNVKNNREYESLNKEIEFQRLEIQLSEKRIKEYGFELTAKKQAINEAQEDLMHRKNDLDNKKKELENIIAETQKEEKALTEYSDKAGSIIEERLLGAYKKIRDNAANGLAVVSIQRDSCGGCFNKVPPQRQLDIRQRKKVIVCEHCGRILVDSDVMKDLSETINT